MSAASRLRRVARYAAYTSLGLALYTVGLTTLLTSGGPFYGTMSILAILGAGISLALASGTERPDIPERDRKPLH